MQSYTDEELKRLQRIELDIYHVFASACKELNLSFIAGYGTALGTVRHCGFIPWDDDMDILMMRDDYERLVKNAGSIFEFPYELQEVRITDGYVIPFAKLTRRDTVFIEKTGLKTSYHQGIFIDIYPLDYVSDNRKVREKAMRRAWLQARLMVLAEYASPSLPETIKGWRKKAVLVLCAVISRLIRLPGLTSKKIYKKYLETVTSMKCEKEQGLLMELSQFRTEGPRDNGIIVYEEGELFPPRQMSFEMKIMQMPADPDRYLEKTYGDYLETPPKEKRHNHLPEVLSFPKIDL